MREYKPNQPKIVCRGGCRAFNYTRWRESHGWWSQESRVPNADWEALYGPVLRGLAWEYQGKVQSCFVINSYRFFSGFFAEGVQRLRGPTQQSTFELFWCFNMFQLFREKHGKHKKATPTQKAPVLKPPNLCCQTHRTIASKLSLRHAITLLEDLCQQAGWKMWKSLHRWGPMDS